MIYILSSHLFVVFFILFEKSIQILNKYAILRLSHRIYANEEGYEEVFGIHVFFW